MLPQVGLTIYYLGEMRTTAGIVSDYAAYLDALGQARHGMELLHLPAATRVTEASGMEYAHSANALKRSLAKAFVFLPNFKETEQQLVLGINDVAARAQGWFQAIDRARESAPDPAAFRRLVQSPEDSGSDVLSLAQRHQDAMSELRERFISATNDAVAELRAEHKYATKLVGHGDRNLITLTMLVFIFLAVLFVVLPENLVRPLRAMARGIREAGQGRLDVQLSIPEDDELGALATAYNDTMRVLQDFDARKRDRIIADGGRLEGVLRTISVPAAILTPSYLTDASNPQFRKLFSLQSVDAERPLPSIFEDGRRELTDLLDEVVHRRDALLDVDLRLSCKGIASSHLLSAHPCRDRRGRLVGIVITLHPNGEKTATSADLSTG